MTHNIYVSTYMLCLIFFPRKFNSRPLIAHSGPARLCVTNFSLSSHPPAKEHTMKEIKNVIVVMMDTLQYNYLGCYGNT